MLVWSCRGNSIALCHSVIRRAVSYFYIWTCDLHLGEEWPPLSVKMWSPSLASIWLPLLPKFWVNSYLVAVITQHPIHTSYSRISFPLLFSILVNSSPHVFTYILFLTLRSSTSLSYSLLNHSIHASYYQIVPIERLLHIHTHTCRHPTSVHWYSVLHFHH